MTERNPKISVVIPTYNRPKRIERALKSVFRQTFNDFEVIVVDDGLKIRAEDVISKIDDDRLRYIQHEVNKGAPAARNTGIKHARGEYVAFLDDDDEFLPEKLEKQYKFIEKNKEDIGFLFSAIIDSKNREQKIDKKGINDFFEDIIAHNIRTYTPTLMIKRTVLEEVGGFDVKFPSNQEWDLMIRISKKYKGYFLNEILTKVNYSEDDSVGLSWTRRVDGREMILNKHFDELKKRPKVLSKHYFQLGVFCRNDNRAKESIIFFIKAWLAYKMNLIAFKHIFISLLGPTIYNMIKK